MSFSQMVSKFQLNFDAMITDMSYLFIAEVDHEELWNLYLDSFPEGTNEIFRENREYDCNCCRRFIRDFGGVVLIDPLTLEVKSIWRCDIGDIFQPVFDAMADYVESRSVCGVFLTDTLVIGQHETVDFNRPGVMYSHLALDLPDRISTYPEVQFGSLRSRYQSTVSVMSRSFGEILPDAIETVLDLTSTNALYKGEEWEQVLVKFLELQAAYLELEDANKQAVYCWLKAATEPRIEMLSRLRNTSMGTLLTDLSEGIDLERAVRSYEKITAPSNYKRPKAIFTTKMVEQAKEKLVELGYDHSLGRRHATIDDVSINDVIWANRDAVKRMKDGMDVFDDLKKEASVAKKDFSHVEEMSIEDFIRDILPTSDSIEMYVEGRHTSNFMSIIAPTDAEAKSMLKWGNNFSWSYNGNITDSMRELVKAFGGDVNGVLRFSIKWNEDGQCNDDYDAHCIEPDGNRIYFSAMRNPYTLGMLDVDIRNPNGKVAIENITWPDPNKMREGKYQFGVHNYQDRGGRSGFTAEIEYNGEIHTFAYPKHIHSQEMVLVAEGTYSRKDGFKITKGLDSEVASREVWGLQTNTFVPVSAIMYSPNYWEKGNGTGHRHYCFMMDDCQNPDNARGFYNEFLDGALMEHKRVFEALGGKMLVEPSEHQLSGLGFSSTKRNNVVVKVSGETDRMIKITF